MSGFKVIEKGPPKSPRTHPTSFHHGFRKQTSPKEKEAGWIGIGGGVISQPNFKKPFCFLFRQKCTEKRTELHHTRAEKSGTSRDLQTILVVFNSLCADVHQLAIL